MARQTMTRERNLDKKLYNINLFLNYFEFINFKLKCQKERANLWKHESFVLAVISTSNASSRKKV